MNYLTRFFHLVIIVSFLILFFSLTSYAFAAQGQTAEMLFQQANGMYGQGKYQQALTIYTKIARKDGFSGSLLYNTANCYAQLGRTGMAILDYERALRLSPSDSDIRGNLELIRKNQGLFQERQPLVKRVISLLDLDQWTLLAGLFFVFFTVLCLSGLRFSNGKQMRRWMGGVCLLFMLVASAGAALQYRRLDAAVVVGDNARLLLSPFPSASSVGSLREGRVVMYLSRHGNYSLVEDEAGRSGWIDTGDIAFISGTSKPAQYRHSSSTR